MDVISCVLVSLQLLDTLLLLFCAASHFFSEPINNTCNSFGRIITLKVFSLFDECHVVLPERLFPLTLADVYIFLPASRWSDSHTEQLYFPPPPGSKRADDGGHQRAGSSPASICFFSLPAHSSLVSPPPLPGQESPHPITLTVTHPSPPCSDLR